MPAYFYTGRRCSSIINVFQCHYGQWDHLESTGFYIVILNTANLAYLPMYCKLWVWQTLVLLLNVFTAWYNLYLTGQVYRATQQHTFNKSKIPNLDPTQLHPVGHPPVIAYNKHVGI